MNLGRCVSSVPHLEAWWSEHLGVHWGEGDHPLQCLAHQQVWPPKARPEGPHKVPTRCAGSGGPRLRGVQGAERQSSLLTQIRWLPPQHGQGAQGLIAASSI